MSGCHVAIGSKNSGRSETFREIRFFISVPHFFPHLSFVSLLLLALNFSSCSMEQDTPRLLDLLRLRRFVQRSWYTVHRCSAELHSQQRHRPVTVTRWMAAALN